MTININKLRLANKKVYLTADIDNFESDDIFLDELAAALNNGVQIVQLSENKSGVKRLITIGKRVRELCSIYNALFIINSRIDIAQLVEADGIFLNENDMDIRDAKQLSDNMIIGQSVSNSEEALIAQKSGADYISINNKLTTLVEKNIEIPFFSISNQNKLQPKNQQKN